MTASDGPDMLDGYQFEMNSLDIEGQTASVDWLTVTARDPGHQELLVAESRRLLDLLKDAGNVQRPWSFKGYNGWSCASFRYGARDDGMIVMMSGSAADLNWPVMLAWCDNVSRIDLAVTITLAEPEKDVARKAYNFLTLGGARAGNQPRKLSFIENNHGGQTFYLGSRASDQYGRLYDKGREKNHGADIPQGRIWRYEVEFKQYRAMRVATQLLDAARREELPVRDYIAATTYKWYLSRGVKPIWDADEDLAFHMEVYAKLTDDDVSLRWLSTQVSPTVRRLIRVGKGDDVLQALGLTSS